MDRIGATDRGLRRLDPPARQAGTLEVAMTLVLVMILVALFIVLIVTVLVGQSRPRADRRRRRRRANLPIGDEVADRRQG
jgi:hypothetical protein